MDTPVLIAVCAAGGALLLTAVIITAVVIHHKRYASELLHVAVTMVTRAIDFLLDSYCRKHRLASKSSSRDGE